MIVTRLIGGLGNQMFQYAAGRALALRRGSELRIDRGAFATYDVRPYALGPLALKAPDAQPADIPPARPPSFFKRLLRPRPHTHLVKETSLRFDPAVFNAADGAYLDGYWQSERYFVDAVEAIRADFTVAHAPDAANAAILAKAAGEASVSVHVRRGDYVSNPDAHAVHGTCTPDYYRQAAELLAARVGTGLTAFIFSDDHDWARAHIRLPFPTVHVDFNDGDHPHEDLRLMSACRHHIIANSTLSWWGAWLDARDGLVIAPNRWFAAAHMDATDIVPERWLRV